MADRTQGTQPTQLNSGRDNPRISGWLCARPPQRTARGAVRSPGISIRKFTEEQACRGCDDTALDPNFLQTPRIGTLAALDTEAAARSDYGAQPWGAGL